MSNYYIYISENVHAIHYFGNKIIINRGDEMLRLNQQLSTICKIVLRTKECTLEQLTDDFITEHGITHVQNASRQKIKNLLEYQITKTKYGKFIFYTGKKNNVNKFIVTGVEGKYYPLALTIEVTNQCNLKCSHCYKNADPTKNDYLNLSDIENLCRILPNNIDFSISGGECTLYPHFNNLIRYLHTIGNVAVITNGINLRNIDENILQLVNQYQISIYGLNDKEYYSNTGITNGLHKLKESVYKLKHYNCNYSMSIILDKDKIDKLEKYILLAIELGAKNIQVGLPSKSGRLSRETPMNKNWFLNEDDIKKAYRLLRLLSEKYKNYISVGVWEREVLRKKYSRNDPNSPYNYYSPHCMGCGAGTFHWTINEKLRVRPCALIPEEFESANFDLDAFYKFIEGDIQINWDKIMSKFEAECNKTGINSADYCDNFSSFLHEPIGTLRSFANPTSLS